MVPATLFYLSSSIGWDTLVVSLELMSSNKKRKGHNDEDENVPVAAKASKRTSHSDAPTARQPKRAGSGQSKANTSVQKTADIPDRPKRQNAGQGGAIAQLRAAGERIRPDLRTPTPKPATNDIPENIQRNTMAPPQAKPAMKNTAVVVKKHDPPLGSGPAKPIHQGSNDKGSVGGFGFHSNFSPTIAQRAPPSPPPSQRPSLVMKAPAPLELRFPQELTTGNISRSQAMTSRRRHGHDYDEIVPDSNDEEELQGPRSSDESDAFVPDPEEQEEMDADPDADVDVDVQMTNRSEEELEEGSQEPQDLFIDEQSPDEDERQAAQALAALNGAASQHRSSSVDPFSVVDAHRSRNRKVHAPNPKVLQAAQNRQHATTRSASNDDEELMAGDADTEDNAGPRKQRATRNSNISSGEERKPTQIRYYPGPWIEILDNAKRKFRLYVHTQEGFPEKTTAILLTIKEFILEAVAEYKHVSNVPLDESLYNAQHMCNLVFGDTSTFRGRIKSLACHMLSNHFYDVLHPVIEDGHNQYYLEQMISNCVEGILAKGKCFLGGLDDEGHTKNFGHPMIADLCMTFYYKGPDSLAALYPEMFDKSLPRGCLAMACVCILHALREFRNGYHIPGDFKGETYASAYQGIWELIDSVDEHEYHGPSLERTLEAIARDGMHKYRRRRGRASDFDLAVVLD
ncbi:hypothetical protein Hypma_004171 [Hypsizygus marmoreus]|uniref:DUF6532 domain-containing protein n=1 Tax=Hypsizygus marmoreus TaxID=39966 RepID=A0A369J095_HYPMA|nr:hypothetical protein Hypma_004171 [Hypsizygus marmoreus]